MQRTGWGKSAVYFVATALLREAAPGPTVIVSPLLALMRNQIAAAERAGIRAVTINSTNIEEWEPIQDAIAAGEVDVLLVSPERLNNPGFRDEVLPRLAATCGLLVVDEAHCISDWGHDFRPDYRRIRTLLADLPDGIPVLATTATANARVTADVAEQLGTDVLVLRGSLDRESLHLGVVRLKTAEQRLAWLADHLAEQPGSGIIYCLTVAATQEIADYLRSRGHDVAAYSGQTEPTERQALEQDLIAGRVKALVATSALGMGFDATLGFVVNMGAPASPVAYYQQVGRAGRGTDQGATVVLLPAIEDRDIWAYFASLAFPREELVRQTLAVLADAGRPLSTAALETYVELNRTRLETMLKVLDVDGAVRRVRGGWEATGQEWAYDEERYRRVAEAREREQQAMLDYLDTDRCRMRFLRDQLDDPEAGGLRALRQLRRPGPVGRGLGRRGRGGRRPAVPARGGGRAAQDVADRRWPTSASTSRARSPTARTRAVRWPGSPTSATARRCATCSAPASPTDPVPVPLVRAVIEVLGDWRPGVDGIVVVESAHPAHAHRRPRRRAVALPQGAGRGRFAIVDPVGRAGAGGHELRPARGRGRRRFRLDADELGRRRVLLVDDLVVTGWTLTLAARAVRRAGATPYSR